MEWVEIAGYGMGLVIGAILGLLGGGGSVLIMPVLVYLFHILPAEATAYSLFVVGCGALMGTFGSLKRNQVDWKTGGLFAVPSMLAVYTVQRWGLPAIPETWTMAHYEMSKDTLIMGTFAFMMIAAAYSMLKRQTALKPKSFGNGLWWIIAAEGLVAGAITGFVGAGGGFFNCPCTRHFVGHVHGNRRRNIPDDHFRQIPRRLFWLFGKWGRGRLDVNFAIHGTHCGGNARGNLAEKSCEGLHFKANFRVVHFADGSRHLANGIELKESTMVIEQIYTGCLAQGAYYIESEGFAMIIDPLRNAKTYVERAAKNGAKITHILETHFHADFVSGHVELAEATGATIVFGPQANPTFPFHQAVHNEEIALGSCTIRVLHTPGHTMESTCYLLLDAERTPYALFTGDTLFIGDVGRPDLAQKSAEITQEQLASTLFHSLRNEIMTLPSQVMIYPAHGAGSACGKNISSKTWDSLENQLKTNYALRADMSEQEFVDEVTNGLLPPPAYFPENVALNKQTIPALEKVLERNNLALSPDEFEAHHQIEEALIVDTRTKEEFAESHIPGSIFIGIDGNFAPWVGALIKDVKQRLLIVATKGTESEVLTRMSRVGFDGAIGYLQGGIEAWKLAGKTCDHINQITPEAFAQLYNAEEESLLDVRKPGEFQAEHVDGAFSIPLDFVNEKMHTLNDSSHYYAHCLSGYRSAIFISILKARGMHNITDIKGGWEAMTKTTLPTTDFVCSSKVK